MKKFSIMTEKATFSQVVKNRGFLNLWINQVLVQLSNNALNFALIIWVFRLTDSNIAVALLLSCIHLPAIILGLFAGVMVDIIDRKKIIMVINLILCFAFFSLIFLKQSYLAILAITFIVNAAGQFYGPAEASAIPIVVRKNQLMIANSLFSATLYSCFLIGFGLAGPLINYLGINFVFGLGGLCLAVAFLLSLTFPSINVDADEQDQKMLLAFKRRDFLVIYQIAKREIIDTLKLIKGRLPVLSSIVILSGVQVVIGVIAVLAPGFFEKSLQIKATDASYIVVIPLGLGIITGGVILGKVGHGLIKRRLVGKAIVFAGLLFLLLGLAPVISPAIRHFKYPRPLPFFYQPPLSKMLIVGSFLLGIAMVSILVPSQTVLQENTPEKDRGKVFATLAVSMAVLSLFPLLISGFLADVFGTHPIFIGIGAIIFLVGLFGLSPNLFFRKKSLPLHVRQFLGLGHWKD